VVPVILIGICVSGAVGNVLVLLIFARDFQAGKGSEVKALLASLASTDLAVLLLCAPVRALTYYKQTWTLGAFICSTTDWFQHSCVVAKTLILAATTRAEHTPAGPLRQPAWIHGALASIWVLSMLLPIPQMLFATVAQRGGQSVCLSQIPACASEFMSLFYKIYPAAAFAVPAVLTLGYHTSALHSAVNRAPSPRHQSKVTLVLLCLSGALGLTLLPEWGTFAWSRLGDRHPPVGLVVCAQVLLYASSCVSPVILMTMYDDVRQGLVALWLLGTCRGATHARSNRCPTSEGNGAGSGANAVGNALTAEAEKTFPAVPGFPGPRRTLLTPERSPRC
uniref:G-protein coupled receptors family 1 profile domain-containing protein n=1 Tax=Tetraodon nigroviridis TaxID=99883 RepID=H3CYX4_TETNG